jgi:hypothetical protein
MFKLIDILILAGILLTFEISLPTLKRIESYMQSLAIKAHTTGYMSVEELNKKLIQDR